MTFVPVMWICWGVLAVIAAALYLYRSNLERDEDDQIYLDDAFSHEKAEQEAIIAKVNKIEPVVRIVLWILAAATVFVIAYYIIDIAKQF
jgi:type VI protein secretion system component VasF